MRKMRLLALGFGGTIAMIVAAVAVAAPGAETGPSSSQSPYMVRTEPGIVTKSILTVGDSIGGYRMVGIPDGLGAYDNGDGTFTLLANHEIPSGSGVVRDHGAKGAFVSKWVINKSDLSVVSGDDLIKTLNVWDQTLNGGAGGWKVVSTDSEARINRLCSADLPAISAFFNSATGNGYNGRIFTSGEEGGTAGRAFAHVVADGESYEITPWLGNMSFENVVANPSTGDKTAAVSLDDGSASVGQQVYLHVGTKTNTGNPAQKAGLANGGLWGIKADGGKNEYQQPWAVGDEVDFDLVDVSQFAGVGGTTNDATVNTLEEDSQAKGVTNFQRPEDGAWDPNNPSDFYFVTTSSVGPAPAENRTGETRLWRLRFNDPTDPSQGGKLKLLVSGPVGTPDSGGGTQSASSSGPQMLDNLTVNDRGQVIMQEDTGNQAYLASVWIYDIGSGSLAKVAEHDPERFKSGGAAFITKDEESSGIIPAPFLGVGAYLLDVQVHKSDPELVEGGQLLRLHIPPGKFD